MQAELASIEKAIRNLPTQPREVVELRLSDLETRIAILLPPGSDAFKSYEQMITAVRNRVS